MKLPKGYSVTVAIAKVVGAPKGYKGFYEPRVFLNGQPILGINPGFVSEDRAKVRAYGNELAHLHAKSAKA